MVSIDGISGLEHREWYRVTLSKDRHTNKHIFKHPELDAICGGIFSSSNIEIEEVFDRVVRFSLLRRGTIVNPIPYVIFVNLMFSVRSGAQVFLEDIRSRQRSVINFLFMGVTLSPLENGGT